MIRRYFDRLPVRRNRIVQLPQIPKTVAEIVIRVAKIGLRQDSGAQFRLGRRTITIRQQRRAQSITGLRGTGLETDGFPI